MMSVWKRLVIWGPSLLVMCSLGFLARPCFGQNEVMGEIQFIGATQAEKHSGAWIDGQYVGYLDELKGTRKVLLLPGEHEIVFRESGYKDSTQKILVEPGQKQTIRVSLAKDPRVQLPAVTAEIKLAVTPSRAAVFLDDSYLGPVRDFGGAGRALLVGPGKRRIKIALPGYQTFETEVNLVTNQKYTVKTDLVKGSISQAGPLMKEQ